MTSHRTYMIITGCFLVSFGIFFKLFSIFHPYSKKSTVTYRTMENKLRTFHPHLINIVILTLSFTGLLLLIASCFFGDSGDGGEDHNDHDEYGRGDGNKSKKSKYQEYMVKLHDTLSQAKLDQIPPSQSRESQRTEKNLSRGKNQNYIIGRDSNDSWKLDWSWICIRKMVSSKNLYQQIFRGTLNNEVNQTTSKVWIKSAIADPNIISYKVVRETLNEIQIMKKITKHENVSQFFGWCEKQNILYVIIEEPTFNDLRTYLLSHRPRSGTMRNTISGLGDAFNYFRNSRKDSMVGGEGDDSEQLNAALLIRLAQDITRGMEHVHNLNIVHRNLCCKSIHLGEDQYGLTIVAKVSDFYLAHHPDVTLVNDVMQTSLDVPVRWMALENLTMASPHTKMSDVWSFGILLWEMTSFGDVPYSEVTTNDQLVFVLNKDYRLTRPIFCDQELYETMEWCWNLNPDSRPTFCELKEGLTYLLKQKLKTPCTKSNRSFDLKPKFKKVKNSLTKKIFNRDSNYLPKYLKLDKSEKESNECIYISDGSIESEDLET